LNYKGNNQKGLAFHAKAKQKEIQRRKETKKTLLSSLFLPLKSLL